MGTTLTTAAITALKKGVDYIIDDRTSFYALKVPRWIRFKGKKLGVGMFERDGFKIISEKNGDSLTLQSEPFEAKSKKWIGPLWFPDTMEDGSFEASLWGSLLIFHRDAIIKELAIKPKDYDQWAHSIYIFAWQAYGENLYPKAVGARIKQHIAYNAGLWESWVRRLFIFAAILGASLMLATASGCQSLPPSPCHVCFGDGTPGSCEICDDSK